MLLAGRTAVVADFGIAKALSAARTDAGGQSATLTSAGQSLSIPAYMAPEQAAGDPTDHRADIYAWGVMAWELLAGRATGAGASKWEQPFDADLADVFKVQGQIAEQVVKAMQVVLTAGRGAVPSSVTGNRRTLDFQDSC